MPRRSTWLSISAVSSICSIIFVMSAVSGQRREPAPARVAVLAELFTSEGCSSCPPADDLLRRLIADQPVEGVEVIAISEHVDYWNRLGWRDPFSSPQFSQRQSAYARDLWPDQVYTPQIIVDGRARAVGSDWPAVRQLLVEAARAPRATVTITANRSGRAVSVRVAVRDVPVGLAAGSLQAIVAIVEDNLLTTVTRGENARRQLRHDAVVRHMAPIGNIDSTTSPAALSAVLDLESSWSTEHLRLVVFLQDARTHHVVGVAAVRLE